MMNESDPLLPLPSLFLGSNHSNKAIMKNNCFKSFYLDALPVANSCPFNACYFDALKERRKLLRGWDVNSQQIDHVHKFQCANMNEGGKKMSDVLSCSCIEFLGRKNNRSACCLKML